MLENLSLISMKVERSLKGLLRKKKKVHLNLNLKSKRLKNKNPRKKSPKKKKPKNQLLNLLRQQNKNHQVKDSKEKKQGNLFQD